MSDEKQQSSNPPSTESTGQAGKGEAPAAAQAPKKAKPTPAQPSMPIPTPTPFPAVADGMPKEIIRDMRTRGQRYLFINVLLMFLVSIVVFTVGAFFFVVPRIVSQDIELRRIESQLGDAREALHEAQVVLQEMIVEKQEPSAVDTPEPEDEGEGGPPADGSEPLEGAEGEGDKAAGD
jgi:hypothetical protein